MDWFAPLATGVAMRGEDAAKEVKVADGGDDAKELDGDKRVVNNRSRRRLEVIETGISDHLPIVVIVTVGRLRKRPMHSGTGAGIRATFRVSLTLTELSKTYLT